MKNNEVIGILQLLANWEGGTATISKNQAEALRHAIKCVELMPELIKELEYYYDKQPITRGITENLLKKAKEMMECDE